MATEFTLGIDPDTYNSAFAIVKATDATRASRQMFEVVAVWVSPTPAGRSAGADSRVVSWIRGSARGIMSDGLYPLDVRNITRVCVESQVKYPRDAVNPNDLLALARMAGAVAERACSSLPHASLWMPEPRAWKGTMDKANKQIQILRTVGLDPDLTGPAGASVLSKGQRGHVIDAIGLAVWVAQQPLLGRSAAA